MDLKQIQEFKKLFEEQKNKLIYTQYIMKESYQIQAEDLTDMMDLIKSELETSMQVRLRNREALYLRKVEESLRRIATGTFGLCQDCGIEIDIKRLRARPTTTFCVSCKEEVEHQEQNHADERRARLPLTRLRLA